MGYSREPFRIRKIKILEVKRGEHLRSKESQSGSRLLDVGEIRTVEYLGRVRNCGNWEKGNVLMHKLLKLEVLK
jgi:hypothetical protein